MTDSPLKKGQTKHPAGTLSPEEFFRSAYAAGYRFCWIKASQANTVHSKIYAGRYAAAVAAGLHVGPYHFCGPDTRPGDAEAEARLMYKIAGSWQPGDLPDLEDMEECPAGMGPRQIVEWARDYRLAEDRLRGRQGLLYLGNEFRRVYLGSGDEANELVEWDLCQAAYTGGKPPRPFAPWLQTDRPFWQKTDKGVIPGFAGRVDVDVFFGDEAELDLYCGGMARRV